MRSRYFGSDFGGRPRSRDPSATGKLIELSGGQSPRGGHSVETFVCGLGIIALQRSDESRWVHSNALNCIIQIDPYAGADMPPLLAGCEGRIDALFLNIERIGPSRRDAAEPI